MKIKLLLFALLIQGSVLWAQLPRFNHGLTEWTEGWQTYPGNAADVDVAPDGTFWIAGQWNNVQLHYWNSETNSWNYTNGHAHKVAAGPSESWCINLSANYIYRYNPDANGWEQMPGLAREIAAGASGDVFVIGTNACLYKFNPDIQNWEYQGVCDLKKVAVDPDGNPWVIRNNGSVARWNGAGWENLPGCLTEIAIGFDGAVWALGCDWGGGGWSIWRWHGSNWSNVDGRLTSIAVLPNGGAAGSNSNGSIFYRNCNTIVGDYVIQSVHNNLIIDESAPAGRVHLWGYHGGWNQQWRIRRMGDDASLTFQNLQDGRYMDVQGGSIDNGGRYLAWDWHGGANQRFYIDPFDGDYNTNEYVISNQNSGLMMDVAGYAYNYGDYLQQWDYHGDVNQRWRMYQVRLSYAKAEPELALKEVASPDVSTENLGRARLNLYPNPAQEQFTLDIDALEPQKTKLSVSDLTGKVVLQRDLELVKGANQVQVDLESTLPNGMYMVQVAGFKAERIIVQH